MTLSHWISENWFPALIAGMCLAFGAAAAYADQGLIAFVCGLGAGAFLAELDAK